MIIIGEMRLVMVDYIATSKLLCLWTLPSQFMVYLCPCPHIYFVGSGSGLAFWKIYVIYGLSCFYSNHCSAFYFINVLFLIVASL